MVARAQRMRTRMLAARDAHRLPLLAREAQRWTLLAAVPPREVFAVMEQMLGSFPFRFELTGEAPPGSSSSGARGWSAKWSKRVAIHTRWVTCEARRTESGTVVTVTASRGRGPVPRALQLVQLLSRGNAGSRGPSTGAGRSPLVRSAWSPPGRAPPTGCTPSRAGRRRGGPAFSPPAGWRPSPVGREPSPGSASPTVPRASSRPTRSSPLPRRPPARPSSRRPASSDRHRRVARSRPAGGRRCEWPLTDPGLRPERGAHRLVDTPSERSETSRPPSAIASHKVKLPAISRRLGRWSAGTPYVGNHSSA